MGEYAEQYALEVDGVDISRPEKRVWKWSCTVCKKNFSSMLSQRQHIAAKHPERKENILETTTTQ